ncbi:MAG: hypothetical protein A7316_06670 [Candidatus Altiarchaeales archaeon WOR_SM1_86-2]|nr:MAG: hypothetical protein A7316_06670 [Candidatus Altiarchaeales archaeon WOR_SM1_86-2]ODS39582.1 MAG: hypothetical protein A7315_10840 [Candidatus Altiarchaeales archaeon WOR_SM1_79]
MEVKKAVEEDEEPEIEFVKYKNKDFVVIQCPKGMDTPYFVRGEHTPRVRIGSSNMPANKEEIARLYREGSSESQDVYSVRNAGLEDIDLDKIKEYFKESELTTQLDEGHFYDLLKKENFIVEENEKLAPTLAGILLFGKHPWINLPHTTILADRYQGTDMVRWIDKRELNGTIFELIDKSEKFFLENMRTAAWSKGFKTVHKTEYPIEALKEAVINALVHRDYYERENIMIRMFDDRIEILSPGELLRPLTIKQLDDLTYSPKSRNKTIVDVLMRRRLMDKRGTGILRMNNFMHEWDLQKPIFEERCGYFVINFKGPGKPTLSVPDEVLAGLNERQVKGLKLIFKQGRITNSEYAKTFNVSRNTASNDLMNLVKKGLIKRSGVGRGSYYVPKI